MRRPAQFGTKGSVPVSHKQEADGKSDTINKKLYPSLKVDTDKIFQSL